MACTGDCNKKTPVNRIVGERGPQGVKGDTGATGPQGDAGTPGAAGSDGDTGWSPVLAVVEDGERRVHEVVDWTGGTGAKPVELGYLSTTGITATIAAATDIRGTAGAAANANIGSIIFIDNDQFPSFNTVDGLGSGNWLGWALCDGRNGTIDMRFRTPFGFDYNHPDDDGGRVVKTYASVIDTPIGNEEHTLTEGELPSHTHSVNINGTTSANGAHNHGIASRNNKFESGGTNSVMDGGSGIKLTSTAGNHTHTVNINGNTGSGNGSGTSFQILPPGIILAPVKKIS